LILKERRKHPTWGPKKIRDLLIKIHGIERPPRESTIALVLSRHGLSQKRKRKVGVHRVRPEHLTEPTRSNEVWTVDFKGWFTLKDGQRCDPLTVCDRYSRYIICCHGCANQQFKGTLRVFKKLMRHHGLPEIIRVDNGTPFASGALGGLSQLSVWWIEQGIRVEFMTPTSPQENGSHERMHRDLKKRKQRSRHPRTYRPRRSALSVGAMSIITIVLMRVWTCFDLLKFTARAPSALARNTRYAILKATKLCARVAQDTSLIKAQTST